MAITSVTMPTCNRRYLVTRCCKMLAERLLLVLCLGSFTKLNLVILRGQREREFQDLVTRRHSQDELLGLMPGPNPAIFNAKKYPTFYGWVRRDSAPRGAAIVC